MPEEHIDGTDFNANLLPNHVEILKRSAISPTVAHARGYHSITDRDELRRLGFHSRQGNVPALAIPIHTVEGRVAFELIRPDVPRILDGRRLKYEQPKGTTLTLDVPPSTRLILDDPNTPLWITDGPRQADALATRGNASVGVLGFRAWRQFRRSGKPPLPDWGKIVLRGRQVTLAFGSQSRSTPEGTAELERLTLFLGAQGADLKHAIPSPGANNERVAIDDILAAGIDPQTLVTDPPNDSTKVAGTEAVVDHPYIATEKGFFLEVQDGDEIYLKQLTSHSEKRETGTWTTGRISPGIVSIRKRHRFGRDGSNSVQD